jgi:hypothetical protein
MRRFHCTAMCLCLLPFLFTLTSRRCFADPPYINQLYVDTTIQRAYYNLTAATDVAGMGPKMEQAIGYAKQVIARLKNIAKGNPNEKYILWKVGELESQVYLEESGLLLEKQNKKQKMINDRVTDFNTELGRRRPDFARLDAICLQANAIDASTGFDMQQSLALRKKNIAKEAVASLEYAVDNGDYDVARIEVVYLRDNLAPLGISLSEFSMLKAKVLAKVTVESDREFIVSYSKKIEEFLAKNNLSEARSALAVFKDRVDGLKGQIMNKEWDRYFFKNKRLSETLERKEDSLVKTNLFILSSQGITEANTFFETVVKKLGVAPEKIGKIDLAILERAMANKKLQDTTVIKELASLPQTTPDDSSTLFSDLITAAKKKARAKEDSARAETQSHVHLTQAEEVRQTNMRLLAEGQKKRNEQQHKDNEEKANKKMVEIYTLLEKKEYKKAFDEYSDRQAFLARYIPAPAFTALDSTVNARYASVIKKKRP